MQPAVTLSEDEYIATERRAETKSEYLRGQVYAMAGASPRHNLITTNVLAALHAALRRRPCVVLGSDQRIFIDETGLYTYPDVVVVCGPPQMHPRFDENLMNPTLLVEVLSRSTEAYDRGAKFAHYRRLGALREYVLVAQDERIIEHFARNPDESWRLTTWTGAQRMPLAALDCELALDDVYDKVDALPASAEIEPFPPRPRAVR